MSRSTIERASLQRHGPIIVSRLQFMIIEEDGRAFASRLRVDTLKACLLHKRRGYRLTRERNGRSITCIVLPFQGRTGRTRWQIDHKTVSAPKLMEVLCAV